MNVHLSDTSGPSMYIQGYFLSQSIPHGYPSSSANPSSRRRSTKLGLTLVSVCAENKYRILLSKS